MDPSYNNSFGGQGGQMRRPVISSGGGDVVLPVAKNGGNKKKWLAAVGVALLLIAGGLGIAAWALSRSDGGNTNSGYVTKFNNFANYVISGEVKNEKISGLYEVGGVYKIDDVIIDGDREEQEEYFQVAESLWSKFNDEYSETEAGKNDNYVINNYISSLEKNLRFMIDYVNAEDDVKKDVVRDFKGLGTGENITLAMVKKIADDSCSKISKYVFLISGMIESPSSELLNKESENEESE